MCIRDSFATVSYNFCQRFDSQTVEKIFVWILEEINRAGYLSPEVVFVDGTHVKANACLLYTSSTGKLSPVSAASFTALSPSNTRPSTGTLSPGRTTNVDVYKRQGLNKAKTSAIAMEARAFGAYPTRTQTKLYGVSWKGRLFALIPWAVFILYMALIVINKDWAFLRT